MAIKFSAKELPAPTAAAKPAKAAVDVKKPSVTPKQADGAGDAGRRAVGAKAPRYNPNSQPVEAPVAREWTVQPDG